MPTRPLYVTPLFVTLALAACDDGSSMPDAVDFDSGMATDGTAAPLADASPADASPADASPADAMPPPVTCAPPAEMPQPISGNGGCFYDERWDAYPVLWVPIDALYGDECDPCRFPKVRVSSAHHMALAGRCEVMAGVRISGDFVDLAPLAGLRHVDRLVISRNWRLESLAGLEGLRTVGRLDVNNNLLLRDLTGLENLSRIGTIFLEGGGLVEGEGLRLPGLDGLHALAAADTIILADFPELQALDAPPCLRSLEALTLNGLGPIDDLGAFADLGVRNLSVIDCPALTDLSSIGEVVGAERLVISENPALTALPSLVDPSPRVTIHLHDNPELTSLRGLEQVTSAATVWISGSPALATLEGLDGLTRTEFWLTLEALGVSDLGVLDVEVGGSLRIRDNPRLTNIDGLRTAPRMETVEIVDNPRLERIAGLGALQEAALFTVTGNARLTSIQDAARLTRLEELHITENASLADLEGLSSLSIVDGPLRVADNPALPACVVDALLAQLDRVCPACTGNDGPLDGCP